MHGKSMRETCMGVNISQSLFGADSTRLSDGF